MLTKKVTKANKESKQKDIISEAQDIFNDMDKDGYGQEDNSVMTKPGNDMDEPIAGDLNADVDEAGEMSEIEPDLDMDFEGGEITDLDHIEDLETDSQEVVKPALQQAKDAIEDVANVLDVALDDAEEGLENINQAEAGENMADNEMAGMEMEAGEGEGLEGTEEHEATETPEQEELEHELKPEEEAKEEEEIRESVYKSIMKEADDTSFVSTGSKRGETKGFEPGEHTPAVADKNVKVKKPESDGVKKPEKVTDGSEAGNSMQTGETDKGKADKNVTVATPKDDQSIGGNPANKKPYNVAKDGKETIVGDGAQNMGFGLDKSGWHSTPDKTAKEAFEKRAGEIFEETFKKTFSLKGKKGKNEDEKDAKENKEGKKDEEKD